MTHSQTQGAEGAGTKTAGQMAMPRNKWREPDHHPIIGRWHVRHEIEAAADTGYLFGKNFVTLDDALAFCERQKGQCRLLFHVADDRWLRVDRPFQFYFVGDADRTPAPAATPGVPDSVRALSEAASPDWDTNEATPYILGPPIDGEIDRFEVIARGPHGHAKSGDAIRKWQANRMFAVAAVNFVRTLIAAQPAGHTKGSIEHGPGAASMATPDYNIAAQPAGQSTDDDTSRCEVCNKPLIAGQRVMQDVELGTVHAACCGPEREAYVKDVETGEPLGPNDPIPHGYVYEGEEPAGQSTGLGADAAAWKERLERAFYDAGGFYGQMVEYAARTALPVVLAAIKPAPDSTRTGAAETSAEDDITQAMIQAGADARTVLTEACKPWEHYTGEPPDDGSPLSGVFVAGMVYTERLLAKLLNVTHYEGGDGSEDFDSDATQTLRNILTGAGLWDADENRAVKPAPDSTRTGPVGTEEAVAVPASALRWLFSEGPDADGRWFGDWQDGDPVLSGTFWWRSEFRRRIEAARPAAPEAQGAERVRHVKRGTEYEVLGEAEAQVAYGDLSIPVDDGEDMVGRELFDGENITVYRCTKTGKLWCRFTDEFRDGRFVPAPSGQKG